MDSLNQATEIIKVIVNAVIIPMLPAISAYLIALIKKKTSELENNIKNKELLKYLNIAENAVLTAVTAVSQTYVDALKKANGSLTHFEQKTAFRMAKEKVLAIIGESGLQALKSLYDDAEVWIENKIEYYVSLDITGDTSLRKKSSDLVWRDEL